MRALAFGVSGVIALTVGAAAQAASMSNGFLSMTINDTNGTIDSATLGGTEFYQIDALVSDYGFQIGTDTSTFAIARTGGSLTSNLTVSEVTQLTPRSVRVRGRWQVGTTVDVSIGRTYTLLNGLNVVRIDTVVSNNRPSGNALIRHFGTYDPDQGGSGANSTINDVTTVQSNRVGIASIGSGLAVGVGGPPLGNPPMVVGFGGGTSPFGLGIDDGTELNTFFASPFDPAGASADIGVTVGRQLGTPAGTSRTFRYYHAFGTTVADVEAGFVFGAKEAAGSGAVAAAGITVTPIPAALPLLATAMGGLGFLGWRRSRKAKA